jgi:putative aldouronate transport system permease protein
MSWRFQRFKKSGQTFIYMPHFFSWVIVGGIFITLLQPNGGVINEFLWASGRD